MPRASARRRRTRRLVQAGLPVPRFCVDARPTHPALCTGTQESARGVFPRKRRARVAAPWRQARLMQGAIVPEGLEACSRLGEASPRRGPGVVRSSHWSRPRWIELCRPVQSYSDWSDEDSHWRACCGGAWQRACSAHGDPRSEFPPHAMAVPDPAVGPARGGRRLSRTAAVDARQRGPGWARRRAGRGGAGTATCSIAQGG